MKYRVFQVGGDPDNDFCLYDNLKRLLNDLQNNGFRIERIDYHEISRAWSLEGKYKKTSEYIIFATESEDEKMSEETIERIAYRIERIAYRLIRIEVRRFDRTTTDSELANYVRGVIDLQTQLYEELNKTESEDKNE